MFLKPGMQVPVSQLIRGINLQSGNDACVAMADFAAGSRDAFVGLMNSYVNALGLKNTHFQTVHGTGRRRTIQFSSRYGADWSGVNSRCA